MSDLTEAQMDEYRSATQESMVSREHQDGRLIVHLMTDREIAEETLILLRAFGDALQAAGQNPMLRAIPGLSGILGKK